MLIRKYFELDNGQLERFALLDELYRRWNSQINVISRRDAGFLYERHVLHSLAISKVVNFEQNARVLDVGTGGGFPGIPLAILFPETQFFLIDSIGKKLKVVDDVIESLKLKNVLTQQIRAEQVVGKYDFVVSRAVTSLSVFLPWMNGKISENSKHSLPNGMLFLKGGDLTKEIVACKRKATVYNISDFFEENFFEEKKIVYIAG